MRNLALDFDWSGRGLSAAAIALAFAIAGCQTWSPLARATAPDPLADMEKIVTAEPAAREAMWLATRNDGTPGSQLHTALLQSVPGHPGYDPGAAEHGLQALLAKDAPPEMASVARIRLAELRASGNCQTRVDELKKQVTKIVEIERKMNHREDR